MIDAAPSDTTRWYANFVRVAAWKLGAWEPFAPRQSRSINDITQNWELNPGTDDIENCQLPSLH